MRRRLALACLAAVLAAAVPAVAADGEDADAAAERRALFAEVPAVLHGDLRALERRCRAAGGTLARRQDDLAYTLTRAKDGLDAEVLDARGLGCDGADETPWVGSHGIEMFIRVPVPGGQARLAFHGHSRGYELTRQGGTLTMQVAAGNSCPRLRGPCYLLYRFDGRRFVKTGERPYD